MKRSVAVVSLIVSTFLYTACGEKEAAEAKPAEPSPGELVYNKNCKVCHAQGINGAPMLGNKAMWQERIEKGLPMLMEHANNGFGLMPAKGGNMALTEEEIASAVKFMVSKVQ